MLIQIGTTKYKGIPFNIIIVGNQKKFLSREPVVILVKNINKIKNVGSYVDSLRFFGITGKRLANDNEIYNELIK